MKVLRCNEEDTANSSFELGTWSEKGINGEVDIKKALKHYRRAALQVNTAKLINDWWVFGMMRK